MVRKTKKTKKKDKPTKELKIFKKIEGKSYLINGLTPKEVRNNPKRKKKWHKKFSRNTHKKGNYFRILKNRIYLRPKKK